jgi:hypothetical protein
VATSEINQHSGALSSAIMKYSDNFMKMSDLYTDCGFDEFKRLYTHTSTIMNDYANSVMEQAKEISTKMNDMLIFHHNETKSFHEIWKSKEDLRLMVERVETRLEAKKESLWINRYKGNFTRWELHNDDLDTLQDWIDNE